MNDNLVDQLRTRAEKAEAACAELKGLIMREVRIPYNCHCPQCNETRNKVKHAISTDCGKDYVHRSELDKAQAACAEVRNSLFRVSERSWFKDYMHREHSHVKRALSTDCGKEMLDRVEKAEKLRDASRALEDYCMAHPENVRDIPDEIWVPFRQALEVEK